MFESSALESLLDTSSPFDAYKVGLLEQLVNAMLTGQAAERAIANEALSRLKANSEAWRIVGTILQFSKESNTRFFALSILEECIQTRWNIFPIEQRNGVKQYVTDLAITISTQRSAEEENFFLTKVNKVLVQVVKQEWPNNWPTFIPDLCAAARTNQALCENCMKILSLLSEEVFDFGKDQLTSQRMKLLMTSLNEQFQQIYDLCMFVIQNAVQSPGSVEQSLLVATLQCLNLYLKWIPYEYIFDTKLLYILMTFFWVPPEYRIECLRCLTEITSLKTLPPDGAEKLGNSLWCLLIQRISELPELTMNYDSRTVAHSRLFWETFYCQLALCLTTMLKNHRTTVCEIYPDYEKGTQSVNFALQFLDKITSKVVHEETFKISVDYWHSLAESLLNEVRENHKAAKSVEASEASLNLLMLDSTSAAPDELTPLECPEKYSQKLSFYQPTLNSVRKSLILRMARPREVCIHYDEETGAVDRDYEVDTDEVALYNSMRETLVYLTNLGGKEMQDVIMELLKTLTNDAKNPNQRNWNPTILNRLCWALGSISGSMSADRERSFLVHIIRELLWLCEHKRGKENKAIVASMIMYVFGQYPRFLKSYVRFLEIVLKKLFEFMQETFPGVQEMACETFLKISQKCAKTLGTTSTNSSQPLSRPLIQEILPRVPELYVQLHSLNKQLMLYESLGQIVAAADTIGEQETYISELCSPFATQWTQIILEFASSANASSILPAELFHPQTSRKLTEVLRIYERLAKTTGIAFTQQLTSIYHEMLRIYNIYSKRISEEVRTHGPSIMSHHNLKALRSVKRASLLLVQSYVETATAAPHPDRQQVTPPQVAEEISQIIVPPLLQPVLEDYKSNVPQARDFEVLSVLSTLILHLHRYLLPELTRVFECVFDCTLDMIKNDFHSFPDHRTEFYQFLLTCTQHCFEALFTLTKDQQRYFIESLLWATQHEQPAVAEQGLTILHALLNNISTTHHSIFLPFCQVFYWSILQDVLKVLTDTLHKSGFQLQTLVLMYLIQFVELGRLDQINITKPIVMNHLGDVLIKNFQNLNSSQVELFVLGLFNKSGFPKEFSQHIRDFLIQLKEFAGSSELLEEERLAALALAEELEKQRRLQIPGMMPQYTTAEKIKPEDFD